MAGKKPLVVDLDGTFSTTDTLLELMAHFVSQRPRNIFILLGLLTKDRATVKAQLANRAPIDVSLLPVNPDVVEMIREAKKAKRRVVLATGSDSRVAEAVAKQWGFFDDVLSSSPGTNLTSTEKAKALVERFGDKGFDYVGNDTADISVIQRAENGFLVAPKPSLLKKAEATGTPVVALGSRSPVWWDVFRALRPHQWAKNLLLIVPALAAQSSFAGFALPIIVGIALFSLMSSSAYLVNDVLDIQHDRAHPTKKNRPFASGRVSIRAALLIAPVMAATSVGMSWVYFGSGFTGVLVVYAILTVAYSVKLKRVVLVDVFVLAALYGVRILAGAMAVAVSLSPWLITFSLFAFLSLALVKRFVELSENNRLERVVPGRGYLTSDAPLIALFGVVSGFVGGVVLALYLEDPDTIGAYDNPLVLWGAVPVWLFWITRTWFLAHRKSMKEDPVLFAVTDWPSYVAGALIASAFIFAR